MSARKYEETENFSLVGNKLASKLILSSSKFLRSIFMSGTLFVNSPSDLETIISIGYKKFPLLNKDKEKYKHLALGTSKLNYIDPRITVSILKQFNIPISVYFNKSQMEKFSWAIDYPNVINFIF